MKEILNPKLLRYEGSDHLTATWKVGEDVCAHIDIKEEGKENSFSLGKSLWIGNDVSIKNWCRKDDYLSFVVNRYLPILEVGQP